MAEERSQINADGGGAGGVPAPPGIAAARRTRIWTMWSARLIVAAGVVGFVVWGVMWWRDRPPAGLIARIAAEEGNLSSVAFSQDGTRLAAGTAAGKVLLWELPGGTPVPLFQYSQQPITALATTPDGFLIAATLSRRIFVWDFKTRKARLVPPLPAPITCVAVHPLRTELAIGLSNGTLHFLDTQTAESSQVASAHAGSVKALAFDPRGEVLVSGGADGKLIARDATTHEVRKTLPAHKSDVSGVSFSRHGRSFVSGDWSGTVVLRDSLESDGTVSYHAGDVISGIEFAGEMIVTGGWDGRLRFWSLKQSRIVAEYDTGALVQALAVSPDEKTVATVSPNSRVQLWQVPSGD